MTPAEVPKKGEGAVEHAKSMTDSAHDLFVIAIRLAGFDARELMLAIHRRQRDHSRTVNSRTVLAAMQECAL